jgi:hypothetical protein
MKRDFAELSFGNGHFHGRLASGKANVARLKNRPRWWVNNDKRLSRNNTKFSWRGANLKAALGICHTVPDK